MCGEYFKPSESGLSNLGSPPHVWRILVSTVWKMITTRITSTCVENTESYEDEFRTIWDHLHMCGEYQNQHLMILKGMGSPPHVWRIRNAIRDVFNNGGITSTCVENTDNLMLLAIHSWDHLHMCGEYIY